MIGEFFVAQLNGGLPSGNHSVAGETPTTPLHEQPSRAEEELSARNCTRGSLLSLGATVASACPCPAVSCRRARVVITDRCQGHSTSTPSRSERPGVSLRVCRYPT